MAGGQSRRSAVLCEAGRGPAAVLSGVGQAAPAAMSHECRATPIDSLPPLGTGLAPFAHPAPRHHLHAVAAGFRLTTRRGDASG
jgi:hypothetical protein